MAVCVGPRSCRCGFYAVGIAQIFDIHAAVKDLAASSFNEQQTEAITRELQRLY